MESSNESYHISFFKPTTERAKHNRNMVIWLVSVWFIAVFGFHIVLRIIEKPVPQPAYEEFTQAWTNIEGGGGTEADFRSLARSSLSVLGKMDISPEANTLLRDAFSWSVFQLVPEAQKAELIRMIRDFKTTAESITDLEDQGYLEQKRELSVEVGSMLNLPEYDVRRKIIPFGLEAEDGEQLGAETRAVLPVTMGKYLIHYRSVLTDIRFLGFPFHYFYSAVFLLILFVGLCWIYCIRTDAMNRKLEIAE
jgi:putative solute:sodium symporter small subunit